MYCGEARVPGFWRNLQVGLLLLSKALSFPGTCCHCRVRLVPLRRGKPTQYNHFLFFRMLPKHQFRIWSPCATYIPQRQVVLPLKLCRGRCEAPFCWAESEATCMDSLSNIPLPLLLLVKIVLLSHRVHAGAFLCRMKEMKKEALLSPRTSPLPYYSPGNKKQNQIKNNWNVNAGCNK